MARLLPVSLRARRALAGVAAITWASLAPSTVLAGPAAYVFVPYVDPGTWRLGYAAGTEQARDGARESEHALSLGYTPTARWFTAAYVGWYQEPGQSLRYDAWSWLNHLQLTTPGSGPFDAGVLCEIERPRDRAEGTDVSCGPTFQYDAERLQFNLNVLVEKYVRAATPSPAALTYQWQVKGLWRPGLELGAQGFGEVGPWDHWLPASRQTHVVGPAVFTRWTVAQGRVVDVDGAVLAGIGAGSPRYTLRLRAQHVF
jgi:hypothetical protein